MCVDRLAQQEESLRTEQMQLQCVVSEKQRIISSQQQQIAALDAANHRLLSAMGQLKERFGGSGTQLAAPVTSPAPHSNGTQQRVDAITLSEAGDAGTALKSSFC